MGWSKPFPFCFNERVESSGRLCFAMGGRHSLCVLRDLKGLGSLHFPVGVHTPVGLTDVEVPMLMLYVCYGDDW